MTLAAKLIDANALLNVVWASLVAGVGGTAAFSFAIVGATRFVDMRRSGRAVEAWMFAAVGVRASRHARPEGRPHRRAFAPGGGVERACRRRHPPRGRARVAA